MAVARSSSGGVVICIHIHIHTNLYRAKNRENESEALVQDDWTVKADWKRWNFRWRYVMYFRFFTDDVIFAHKLRLLDVAAQLKRSAHAALGLAINCAH